MVADWKAFLYSHNYCSCKFRNGDLFWHFSNSAWTFFQLWFQLTTYGIILHIHRKNQHSMPIGLEILNSWTKNEKFYKKYIFQLCLCIFSTLITNVLFTKPFPLCAFSLKKSASNLISLGYYESFWFKIELTFFQLCLDIFQLWFQLTTYCIILHIHRKNQHSMPIGLEMLSSWIKNGKFYKKYIFSTLPLHFFNSDYECAFQKTLSPVCLFSEKISFNFHLVRILWII